MTAFVPFMVSPYTFTYSKIKLQYRVRVQSFGDRESILPSGLTRVCRTSFIVLKEKSRILIDGEKRRLKSGVERKCMKDSVSKDLELLWDDGYGTKTVKDYLEAAREIITPDNGPPRWFCPVECKKPLKNSPVLLFLSGNPCQIVINRKFQLDSAISCSEK